MPKAEPKPDDEAAKEAHAKEVRSKMAPNAKRPKDPKAKAEPKEAIKPVAGNVETKKKNPSEGLPPAKTKETAADIYSKNKTGIYDSAEGEDPKAKRVQVGEIFMSPIAASSAVRAGTHQWGSKRDGRASLIPVKGAKTKEATHKPDKNVSAVASNKVNEPAGKADKDVEKVMGKKQPNNPKLKSKKN